MQHPIIFFDGVCNLCNHFVDWLLRQDRAGVFKVASLQGSTAQKLLPADKKTAMSSVILYVPGGSTGSAPAHLLPHIGRNPQVYEASTAALQILKKLPPPWPWFSVFMAIPLPIRDAVYHFVARHRYQIFGQRNTCRVPTPAERERFLD